MATHFILTYHYTDDYLAKRAPLRPSHLAHIRTLVDKGEILGSGILTEANGALLIFYVESRDTVVDFAQSDPYYKAGLIASFDVEPWQVAEGVPAITNPGK